jgi:hypothetical protein
MLTNEIDVDVSPAPVRRSAVTVDLNRGEHEIVVAFDARSGDAVGFHVSFEMPALERAEPCNPRFPVVTQ